MIDLQKDVELCVPPQTIPWLEIELKDDIIKHLWKSIEEGEKNAKDMKSTLAGNISKSFSLTDKNNYFSTEVLMPLCNYYERRAPNNTKDAMSTPPAFDEDGNPIIPCASTLFLDSLWANYQYKHEFNPAHHHSGAFSFVIWMKIPYDSLDQKKEKFLDGTKEESKQPGVFYFEFINMFGEITHSIYEMSPESEGTMLFFPSKLRHGVHPFYSCDEKRVSISGNLKYGFKYSKA